MTSSIKPHRPAIIFQQVDDHHSRPYQHELDQGRLMGQLPDARIKEENCCQDKRRDNQCCEI
ncbi:hypothetical protein, partial [Chryseobacterium sp. SIMBA_028]|uniref:hypothetical protein n=1 Tax=Chryseobacterium sp. SIMBA_028 TaxID=3085771 RepID=UPI00397D4469